jgi:hypothetical protein
MSDTFSPYPPPEYISRSPLSHSATPLRVGSLVGLSVREFEEFNPSNYRSLDETFKIQNIGSRSA